MWPFERKENMKMPEVKLGSKVKDKITGLTGIAVARTCWLHGCVRVTIQPQELKDGKPLDNYTVDEPQCEVIEEEKKPAAAPRHGDRENVGARRCVR